MSIFLQQQLSFFIPRPLFLLFSGYQLWQLYCKYFPSKQINNYLQKLQKKRQQKYKTQTESSLTRKRKSAAFPC